MHLTASVWLCAGLLIPSLHAQEITAWRGSIESGYEKFLQSAVLYHDENNPVLQRFALTGKFHFQWANGNSEQGRFGTRDRPDEVLWGDVEVRRSRIGFDSQWFNTWQLQGSINTTIARGGGLYQGLHDLYLSYEASETLSLSAGKSRAKYFSFEQNTSSEELLVFERSLLVRMLAPAQLTGAWIDWRRNHWSYAAAAFSGDSQEEFSDWNAGVITQASLGYDFADRLDLDKAVVKLDYQYTSDASKLNGPDNFVHALSLNAGLESGRWGLYADLLTGVGRGGQGDVYGMILTPSFFLTDRWQLVGRFQYANGKNDGLFMGNRYEFLAPGMEGEGWGSVYHSTYLGMNYYFHGHRLKWMFGVEYGRLKGTSPYGGFTTLVGLRLTF